MTNIPKSERKNFVGASEVAALFGVHPQITKFEIWHRKAGNIDEPDLSEVERVFWGQTLEPAIAKGIAVQQRWRIRRVRRYIVHPAVPGFGASLDYEILKHPAGMGAFEIKNVDSLVYLDWPEDEPPLHILLQQQAQLACSPNHKWNAAGVLVGGNTPKVFKKDRHTHIIGHIERQVELFWQSIQDNNPPDPDFEKDYAAVALMCRNVTPNLQVVSDDKHIEELCRRYCAAREAAKEANIAKEAAKAELLTLAGTAERIYAGPFTMSRKGNFRITERRDDAAPELSPPPVKAAEFIRKAEAIPLTEQDSIF